VPKKPAVIRDGGLLSSSSLLRHCKPPGCAFGEPDDRLLWRTSTPQRLDSIFKQPSGATARASWFSWRCESIVQRRRLRASSPRGFKIRAPWNDLILRSRVSGVSKDGPATRLQPQPRDLAAWFARVLILDVPPFSTEGAGNAGCALHPWPPVQKKSTGVSNQGYTATAGIPCTMVLRLIRDLPGDHACLPPSSPRRALRASGI